VNQPDRVKHDAIRDIYDAIRNEVRECQGNEQIASGTCVRGRRFGGASGCGACQCRGHRTPASLSQRGRRWTPASLPRWQLSPPPADLAAYAKQKNLTYWTNGITTYCVEKASGTYLYRDGRFVLIIDSD
jgi:hypothetical protein